MEQLREAAGGILPLLCYTDDDIAKFIDIHQERTHYCFYRLELPDGLASLVRTSGFDKGGSTQIVYIIPTDWKARYKLVQAVVEAIKTESQRKGVSEIFTSIVESVPSDNAYYAGMLPLMGFEMAPRVRLVAPFDVLEALDLPQLPDGIEEAGFSEERLSEVADVWYEAEIEHYPDWSEQEKEQKRANCLQDVKQYSQREDKIKTWTTLMHDGRVIGFCVGSVASPSETLDVLALYVAPAFQGRGLGRYLCIRCMQKLHQFYAKPDWRFFVGTFRDWLPAMRLYSNLGFRLDDKDPSVIIYATCKLSTH